MPPQRSGKYILEHVIVRSPVCASIMPGWHTQMLSRGPPVLQQHEAALEGAPPKELLDAYLHSWGVDWQGQQDHAGGNGPIVMVNPPWPDAAPIHLLQPPAQTLVEVTMRNRATQGYCFGCCAE